jgi:tRNA-2-methylthio-N6-dimethylallyladenosine synthase
MTTTKKIHVKTWGCQMNVYDSLRMEDVMMPHGFEATTEQDDADIIVLNTCHIREKAAEKVYSDLGRVRELKEKRAREGKQVLIAVGGCVAQAEGEEILRRAPYVDIVMGSQAYHQLPRLVVEAQKKSGQIALDFPEVQKFDLLPETTKSQGSAAFVAVQEGCDKFCTFCVVPYTRGAEYSRPVADVMREIRDLVEHKGAMEVTLLGQNVNAYHGADEYGKTLSLAGLIAKLAEIDGLERIRYTTSHPRDMSEDLFEAHRDIPKLMPYLHLPIQAGADAVLKKMNRGHKAADYLAIIDKLRSYRPDIAFSGDFIVGFPGETDEDFNDTLRLAETVGYASAYSFKYSPRPGTPASDKADQVPEDVKEKRLALLQTLLNRSGEAFNRQCIGKEMDVILDREGREENQRLGRSPYMQSVHVSNSAHKAGQMVRVRITASTGSSLKGELV